MPTEPLFRPITVSTKAFVEVEFNGRSLAVQGQCSMAAALLAAGVSRFRSTPLSGAPRAPYCMMGVCFECLLETGGESNAPLMKPPRRWRRPSRAMLPTPLDEAQIAELRSVFGATW